MTASCFQPSDWERFIGEGETLDDAIDSGRWLSMDVADVPEHLEVRQ